MTIAGEARVGETLEAVMSADGTPADRFRWQRCNPAAESCDPASGPDGGGWADTGGEASAYLLAPGDTDRMVRVLAKNVSLGTQWGRSPAVGPVAPAQAAPADPADPPADLGDTADPLAEDRPPAEESGAIRGSGSEGQGIPPPEAHETANLEPVTGTVLYKRAGSKDFQVLDDATQVPLGSTIDATDGRVNVISARDETGNSQSAEFWAGRFVLDQTRGAQPITELTLTGPGEATGGRDRQARRAPKNVVRRVWGKGSCRCRTKGRHSSGTVRGTFWLTLDRPDGTLTKVREGAVEVRDFGSGKQVLVEAGERYFAHAGH